MDLTSDDCISTFLFDVIEESHSYLNDICIKPLFAYTITGDRVALFCDGGYMLHHCLKSSLEDLPNRLRNVGKLFKTTEQLGLKVFYGLEKDTYTVFFEENDMSIFVLDVDINTFTTDDLITSYQEVVRSLFVCTTERSPD